MGSSVTTSIIAVWPIRLLLVLVCWALCGSGSCFCAAQQQAAVQITGDDTILNPREDDDDDSAISFSKLGEFLDRSVFGQKNSEDPFSKLATKTAGNGGGGGNLVLDAISDFVKGFATATGDDNDVGGNKATPGDQNGNAMDLSDHFLSNLVASLTAHGENGAAKSNQPSVNEMIDLFWNATLRVRDQLERTFKETTAGYDLNPVKLYYHMLQEESRKDPVYKRREHAFLPTVPESAVLPMADGLFLSQLAYVNDCSHVTKHLKAFHNDSWALVNCTVIGKPSQPAHYLAIRRVADPLPWNQPRNLWERLAKALTDETGSKNVLEVALVIRGSKELADLMSDGLLEPVNYHGGKAHDGILQSAIWIRESYTPFLEQLLQITGRSKIRLWLVGHSLGAGTAALACMEFNEHNSNGAIDAYSIGFGTPAVVSEELSEKAKSKVTTVVNDADCVPRMSGATLVNAWLKASACESWVEEAKHDVRQLRLVANVNFPFPDLANKILSGALDWLDSIQKEELAGAQKSGKTRPRRMIPVLVPPGECVHLFRDGTGWQAAYVPCSSFFDEIESVRHMINDHLIPTGYYQGLLGYIRGIKNDLNWKFEPDLLKLPVA
jgi:Lipase (class 3)